MTWLLSHRYVRYDNQNELKTMKKHINNYSPNKEERLLALPLLRTVRESFPSYRSSLP